LSNLEFIKAKVLESERYLSLSEAHKKRCLDEIDMMNSSPGLSGDTVLEEFINVYKKLQGKDGPRNAVNSCVAYCLSMTSCLPSLSEEFLPSRRIFARAGFPDIDADFDYERRHEVYEYLIEKYGRDRVGNIGTYGTLKMKSYITRVVKALDLANSFHLGKESYVKNNNMLVREIIDSLPEQKGAFLKVRDDEGEDHVIKNLSDAMTHCDSFGQYMKKYSQISDHSNRIEGLASSYGVHAAGIVISGEPLARIAPLRATSKSDENAGAEYATQFAYEDLEYLGLIKFDILALSTLSVISETVKTIKERLGIDIDIQKLPLDDEKSFELYRSGNLTGVFQCEEKGMQKTMMQMGVDRFEDICAGIALFRPGPMASIPKYCGRKNGTESIDYYDDSIVKYVENILKPTYGILVYQEQVMQICNSLAGMTVSDGYQVIKAVGKKKEDQLKKYKSIFVDGCCKNGIDKSLASRYWEEFIMPFAAYGFNKSHSYCYGLLSYQTAYLKANFPAEFMLSYLNVECFQKKWDRVDILIDETRRMGILISAKNLNVCRLKFSMSEDRVGGRTKYTITPSLLCKGLKMSAAEEISLKQPFKSYEDFVQKIDTTVVDTEAITALQDAGFFPKTKDAVDKFIKLRDHIRATRKKGMSGVDIFQ
jgi:DNA polymerase-3 subunit alpha